MSNKHKRNAKQPTPKEKASKVAQGTKTINNLDASQIPNCSWCDKGPNDRAFISFNGEMAVCDQCNFNMMGNTIQQLYNSHMVIRKQFDTIRKLKALCDLNSVVIPDEDDTASQLINAENAKTAEGETKPDEGEDNSPPEDKGHVSH